MRRFTARLLNLLRLRHSDEEMTREIEAHLALIQEDLEAQGLGREAAGRAARLALGGLEQTKERHRASRSFGWLEDARQDLAHGVRLLRRGPLFTLTAALSLAIGIGANTAIFAVANSLLFRPPDGVIDPERLVDIGTARGDGGLNPLPYTAYQEISRNATTLSGVFAQRMSPHVVSLLPPDAPAVERATGQSVTTNFFAVLGARPSVGRLFSAADDEPGTVAVLDHEFWTRRFNQDPSVVGRVFRINGRPYTVVGVAAPGFQGTGVSTRDIWVPMGLDTKGSVVAGGRLRADVPVAAAAAETSAIADAVDRALGRSSGNQPVRVLPYTRAGGNRNIVAGFAGALMIVVSLVLAVACANVSGIMLARSAVRSREMALRTALGAGRGRLVRQLLTETIALFLIGGALGLLLASGLMLLAGRLSSLLIPTALQLSIDWRVLAFAASLSLFAALLSGLVPAFEGSKTDPVTSLKDVSRSSLGRSRLRDLFVVGQVALSVLLVVLAGLFVRALRHAGASQPGFDSRGVEVVALDLSMASGEDSTRADLWRDIIERVRAVPAVDVASLARVPPGGWEGIGLGGIADAETPGSPALYVPAWNIVDAGYFAALRIPLLAGRDFSSADRAGAPLVAIVGEGVARRLWPRTDAIGKSLIVSGFNPQTQQPERRTLQIVGVAGDIKASSLIDGLAEPYVYLPFGQSSDPGMTTAMTIVARGRGALRLGPSIGAVVAEVNPSLVVVRSETLDESVAFALTPHRVLSAVAGSLGLVGLLLASIGIYGITAYSVARRRQEFGIRLALGARPGVIVRMVLSHGMAIVGAGAIVGLSLAAGAGQVLAVFFYGLPAVHAPTSIGTLILVTAIGLLACYLPARRVVGIDPSRALRSD